MKAVIYKRPIAATLHRASGKSTVEIWVRRYSSVTRAITRGVELMLLEGEPGDVLEISSSNFGYQIATVKLRVNAQSLRDLKIDFVTLADGT